MLTNIETSRYKNRNMYGSIVDTAIFDKKLRNPHIIIAPKM